MMGTGQESTHRAIERVARESYGRLVAYLSSHTHDVAGAEDALSEALVAALTTWPRDGVPQNPEAWLLTTARHSLSILYVISK
jgi:RNA polymerase sigma-70 factor (ECF subfamily)